MKSSKKTLKYLGAIIITILFLFNYSKVFDKKLDSNGDNYHYYILGESIHDGNGYRNVNSPSMSLHGHFPPGYPFLISKMMFFSKSTNFIKSVNGFFLLALVLLLYFFFNKYATNSNILISTLIGIFCMMNFHLLKSSTLIMSEIPFALFSILVIILFFMAEKEEKKKMKILYYFLLVFALAITFYIRTVGVVMLLTILIYYLFQKNWLKSVLTIIVSVIIILPWQVRNSNNNIKSSYQSQLLSKNPYNASEGIATSSDFVDRFATNTKRYLSKEIVSGVLPFLNVTYNQKGDQDKSYPITGLLIFLLAFAGLFFLDKKVAFFIFLYIAGTFTVILLWPSQWFGTRFFQPLVPLFLFLMFIAFIELTKLILSKLKIKTKEIPLVIFIIVSLVVMKNFSTKIVELEKFSKTNYYSPVKDYLDLAKFSKLNSNAEAVFSCRKSAMFYVNSNRKSVGYPYNTDDKVILEYFDTNNVSFVVVDRLGYSSTGKYLIPAIQKNPDKFKLVKEFGASKTMLFKYK